MTQTTKTPMTFEEYLQYDDGTDKKYEFVGGELVEMPPESFLKPSEYAARGVGEYWVINPQERKITFYKLIAGFYEEEDSQNLTEFFDFTKGFNH